MPSTYHNCPTCGTSNEAVLSKQLLLLCRNCQSVVLKDENVLGNTEIPKVPEDWSFVQKATTGLYDRNPFTIIGRIRLQLRNDYKNLWCASFRGNEYIWLMESFASFAVLQPTWHTYASSVKTLHAGKAIEIAKDVIVRSEYVEKCESISYQGEVGEWRRIVPGFFVIQASDLRGTTALFIVEGKDPIYFLSGQKMPVEKLELKNIIAWNEWK